MVRIESLGESRARLGAFVQWFCSRNALQGGAGEIERARMANKAKKKTEGALGFEQTLRATADKLRGNLDAAE
jgi:hypothetical protein